MSYIDNDLDNCRYDCEVCDLCIQVQNDKQSIIEELCFWSVGSIEHIDLILQANGTEGLRIPRDILRDFEEIRYKMKNVTIALGCDKKGRYKGIKPCTRKRYKCGCSKKNGKRGCSSYAVEFCERFESDFFDDECICKKQIDYCEVVELLNIFLYENCEFIRAINRVMFQGFAGDANLFQELNHYMIEQMYIARIFDRIVKSPDFIDKKNVLGPDFYFKYGIGCEKVECAYNQMYFWNIISAQHCSILQNITGSFADELPMATYDKLQEFKECFNNANEDLYELITREYFGKRECIMLHKISEDIKILNECFIEVLCCLRPGSKELPCNTPIQFLEARSHILNEQVYYKEFLERATRVLNVGENF